MILVVTHESCALHEAGFGHPERPARLQAALKGLRDAGLDDAARFVPADAASDDALLRVHDPALLRRLAALDDEGGGSIDPDTGMNEHSMTAARRAAGAGITAVAALESGRYRAALCAVRPPGHHASRATAMGFCLLNSIAVTAGALAEAGERVLIVDFDAHHGNGTQDVFYDDDRVLFVSLHQYPWYPGTGHHDETGRGGGTGFTVNVPFPAGTAGPAYRDALERVVWPRVAAFRPTWLLVSAGFDGHRLDPLAQLGLTSGDYADITAEVARMVPAGRVVAFLEGGYHLDGLAWSVGAMVGALLGQPVRPEPASSGEIGLEVVEAVRRRHGLE